MKEKALYESNRIPFKEVGIKIPFTVLFTSIKVFISLLTSSDFIKTISNSTANFSCNLNVIQSREGKDRSRKKIICANVCFNSRMNICGRYCNCLNHERRITRCTVSDCHYVHQFCTIGSERTYVVNNIYMREF